MIGVVLGRYFIDHEQQDSFHLFQVYYLSDSFGEVLDGGAGDIGGVSSLNKSLSLLKPFHVGHHADALQIILGEFRLSCLVIVVIDSV